MTLECVNGLESHGSLWQIPRLEQVYGNPEEFGITVTAMGS